MRDAVARIAADPPDVIVLDLGLPDADGKDVIGWVQEACDVPIVVLSARDREAEKIAALDLGADDYVNKPFGIGELMARLRAALAARGGPGRKRSFSRWQTSRSTASAVVCSGRAKRSS